MVESWGEEEDVISKLLDCSTNDVSKSPHDGNLSKSLHEELLEADDVIRKYSLTDEDPTTTPTRQETVPSRDGSRLQNLMREFTVISGIMDREISKYVSKEQKESSTLSKQMGKVEVLKELLFDQHFKVKRYEEKNKKKINTLEAYYKKRIDNLQNSLENQKQTHQDLEKEFNKVLDRKEQEIENLTAENINLRCTVKENDNNELARENELLEGQIEIKDEYISVLRQQITKLDKKHQQYEWKLEQSDDLLELIEREKEEIETKYKTKISNFLQKIKDGDSSDIKNLKIYLNSSKAKPKSTNGFRQKANDKRGSKSLRPPPGFEHVKHQESKTLDHAGLDINNDFLSPFANNKFPLNNLTTTELLVKNSTTPNVELKEFPVVLKSLGWSDVLLKRNRYKESVLS